MRPGLRVFASAAAVAALAALPLARGLSGHATLSWRDTALLFAPVRGIVVSSLRSGRLPLWNPYEGTGQALLAQSLHAVLHPVTVATALLGGGVDAWLVALVAFGAAGAFLAARAVGASLPGAAGGGLAYALSGYVLGMTGNAVYLAGSASTPWVVAGLALAARRGGRALVAGAAAIACAAFAGDPQSLATGTLAGVVLGAAGSSPGAPLRDVAARVARAAGSVALGAAIAAVQLLPSWAYLGTTSRAGEIASADRLQWPLDPARLVELAAPGFFAGRPRAWQAPVFLALGAPSSYPLPFAPSVFVGAAVLLLAGVAAARSREGRVLAALAAVFAWTALGHHLGATQLLSHVPIWGAFFFPEKLVGATTLCLALGAALGIDRAGEARRLPAVAAAVAGAFGLAAVACAVDAAPVRAILRAAGGAAELARAHLLEGSVHAALGAGAVAVLVALGHRGTGGGRWLAPALAALLYAQSAAASPFALHVGDARAAAACPPALEAPPPGPRILTALVSNVTAPERGMDPIDAAPDRWARLGVASLNVACGVDSVEGYTGIETRRAAATIFDVRQRLALGARLGATHVLSEPPASVEDAQVLRDVTAGGRLVGVDPTLGFAAWEVPHRAWASFAPAARAAASLESAASALAEEVAAGRPTVVVEAAEPPPCGAGRVLAVERGRERIAVEAESSTGGLLVVNDAFDPGWKAWIDGRPADVLAADVLVRAVRWPAGRHRLEMRYEPRAVAVGGWIACAALLGAVAWVAAPGLLSRARRKGTSDAR